MLTSENTAVTNTDDYIIENDESKSVPNTSTQRTKQFKMSNQTDQSITRHGQIWHKSPLSELTWQAQVVLEKLPTLNWESQEDIELCVEVGGDPNNPPLVLIMGLGSQLIFWTDDFLQKLIDAGFYIIRFDNRDMGLSSKINQEGLPKFNVVRAMGRMQLGRANATPVAYTLEDMADDVARLIQTLKLRQPYVLGASMGGMIAQILCAKYPHMVGKLALLFSSNNRPLLPPTRPKQLHTLLKKPASHAKDDIVAHGHWFISNIGTPGHVDEDKVKHLASLRYERCFYPLGTVRQMHAILTTGSMQAYSQAISTPTLILHGTADGLVPHSHGVALAKDIPNAKFVSIEGMAHDIPPYYQPFIVRHLSEHFLGL